MVRIDVFPFLSEIRWWALHHDS